MSSHMQANHGRLGAANTYNLPNTAHLELVQTNFDKENNVLTLRERLQAENSKQLEAIRQVEVKLRTKLEVEAIRKVTSARVDRVSAETRADVAVIQELGRAEVEAVYREPMALSRAFRRTAVALRDYYSALIIDNLAGCVLGLVSQTFSIDPSFRFKLYRPLSIPDEEMPTTEKISKTFLEFSGMEG